MKQDYITTNIRIPKSWHKTLKQRAIDREQSLGELIRGYISQCLPVENIDKGSHFQKKPKGDLLDLLKMAKPLGGDLSSNVDDIVYGPIHRRR
jgi:hypothetical protein